MRARATSAHIQKNSASDNKVTNATRLCIFSVFPILEGGLDDRYSHAAQDGRSCGDCVEPSPQRWLRGDGVAEQFGQKPAGNVRPREGGNIGDRIVGSAEIGALRQSAFHHAKETLGLCAETLDRRREFFWHEYAECAQLTEHRAEATYLPVQPFQRPVSCRARRRQQPAGLFAEEGQDRAAFEQGHRLTLAIVIDDHRHLVVWRNLEKIWRVLLVLADVY